MIILVTSVVRPSGCRRIDAARLTLVGVRSRSSRLKRRQERRAIQLVARYYFGAFWRDDAFELVSILHHTDFCFINHTFLSQPGPTYRMESKSNDKTIADERRRRREARRVKRGRVRDKRRSKRATEDRKQLMLDLRASEVFIYLLYLFILVS